jgi:hypothetical protein
VIPIKIHHHTRGAPRFLNHHSIRVICPTRGRCGPASRSYKGGRNKTPTGYINILVGSEGGRPVYALEHRLVMEKVLGRKLRKGESVPLTRPRRHTVHPDTVRKHYLDATKAFNTDDLLKKMAGILVPK